MRRILISVFVIAMSAVASATVLVPTDLGELSRRVAPEPFPEPTPPPDEGTPPAAGNGAAKSGDAVAARLVATNMALDGASRAEIERALADGYELDDSGTLIDDVLAKTAK